MHAGEHIGHMIRCKLGIHNADIAFRMTGRRRNPPGQPGLSARRAAAQILTERQSCPAVRVATAAVVRDVVAGRCHLAGWLAGDRSPTRLGCGHLASRAGDGVVGRWGSTGRLPGGGAAPGGRVSSTDGRRSGPPEQCRALDVLRLRLRRRRAGRCGGGIAGDGFGERQAAWRWGAWDPLRPVRRGPEHIRGTPGCAA
jgi:hypothetical protein